jgi:salicylate 5-hydroxylase small subunit
MIAAPRLTVQERFAIQDLYAAYVDILDGGRYEEWPQLFCEDCIYRIVPRENWERGLPLSTLSFESRGMLADRVYAVRETLFHEPYTMRHTISNFKIAPDGAGYRVEANYVVIRTKRGISELYSVGRYYDVLAVDDGELRFSEKIAVFDNELIPNSLIYPL